MEPGESERIVIPSGRSDESGASANQQERPPFKPLADVVVPDIGKYEIGVFGDFDSERFSLVALDEDKQQIPLVTIKVEEVDGRKVYTPTENEEAVDFFSAFTDMDKAKELFGPELDSWLEKHS